MGKRGLRLLLLAALAIAAALLWQQHRIAQARAAQERAELQAGLDATRVIDLRFERTARLAVEHLSGTMVTRTDAAGCVFGACHATQVTRAPFVVDYSVELKRPPASTYRWDARDRVMFVEIPDVTVAPPNIDMARAQVQQNGVWISRDMGQAMQARAAANFAAEAAKTARNPENMRRARLAAKIAVRDLVQAPLAAAGLGDVRVEVRLASDPKPVGYRPWDVSRSIEEVLTDPRFRQ